MTTITSMYGLYRYSDKMKLVWCVLVYLMGFCIVALGEPESGCRDDTQLKCKTGRCIPVKWRCDGDSDCGGEDRSDEENCDWKSCAPDEFSCTSGECITRRWKCDGEADCLDGSDETPNVCVSKDSNTCAENQFQCDSGRCLDDVNICNEEADCIDGTDEFNCSSGDLPWLLFANLHDIRKLEVGTWLQQLVVKDLGIAVSLDFYRDKFVYWSDVSSSKIYRSERRNRIMGNKEEIITTNIQTPDGIAIDWVHDLLYWTDTGLNTIMVSNLDGSKMTTLISDFLDEPRGIAVDPRNKYMYITDWGKRPKIEKIGLDGSNRKTIIASGVIWPNSISIDFVDDQLFWIDAKLHKIMTADMDGKNVRTVLYNTEKISHPFALAVFEDEVYWTDWSSASISKANKRTGADYQQVVMGLDSPMDIKIKHESIQQQGYNPCAHQNGGCEFLCLPSPAVSMTDAMKVTCACPDDKILSHNGKNCIAKDETESEKIEDLQNVIAKKITDAMPVPTFGYNDEYDVSNLVKMNALENKKGVNFSLMPYLLKAISMALKLYPMLNSVVDDSFENITSMADHNIGIVMDGPNGVIVPNVKNVQTLNIYEIADELDRLEKPLLQHEQFEPSDLTGGTFSVSWVDGTCSRPVILPNEVAIGAFGRVRVLPRYDEFGNLTKRHIMCASWSTDYRIIKGTYISRFSNRVKYYVENPNRF